MCEHEEIQVLDNSNAECLRCPVTYDVESKNGMQIISMRIG